MDDPCTTTAAAGRYEHVTLAQNEHDDSDASRQSTSTTSRRSSRRDSDCDCDSNSDDGNPETAPYDAIPPVMAHDLTLNTSSCSSSRDTHFSYVALRSSGANDARAVNPSTPAPMATTTSDVSRTIMFSRYARAVPSAQEQRRTATVESLSPATIHLDALSTADAALHICSNTACQALATYKDERIRTLQQALDHMVDAMGIQQRDLALQRAFVARQSEQLTRLSVTLHHEKLALQLERERLQRAATAVAAGSSTSRPPTPRAAQSPSTSSTRKLKGVLSTITGGSARAPSGRRSTTSAPIAMTCSSEPARAPLPSRSASTPGLAVQHSSSLSVDLSDVLQNVGATASSSSLTDVDRSMSLSTLQVRPTYPVASLASVKSMAIDAPLSDVSLQDSPVRFGARSATNGTFTTAKARSAAATVSSTTTQRPASTMGSSSKNSSTATVHDATSPTASSSSADVGKKPSLGERFRSLRWKA